MNKPSASTARSLRLKPLAGCLALALAIGAGAAAAAATLQNADPTFDAMMQRVQGVVASGNASPWSMAQRRQQVLSGNHHPAAHALPAVPAGSPVVTNCNDSGPGSLRETIAAIAVNGDTIDLTQTGCSTITLTTGSLAIGQANLTLQGPGFAALAIDGNYEVSPLRHAGRGTLSVNDLTVAHAVYQLDAAATSHARGGCIYSAGTVSVSGAEVTYCKLQAANTSYHAFGGAIYAQSGVTLSNSTISLGTAGSRGHPGYGGGIDTPGTVSIARSYIGGNYASHSGGGVWVGPPAEQGGNTGIPYRPTLDVGYSTIGNNQAGAFAGGISASGIVLIDHSTLSGNSAIDIGGLSMRRFPSTAAAPNLLNGTVSGNSASARGGVSAGDGSIISNSTIAFNTETQTQSDGTAYGAGLYCGDMVELQSTIVANNVRITDDGRVADDIGGSSFASLTGANNLIMAAASALPPPADTLAVDPLLGPLADNGGPTLTHALSAQSPAIAAGNNAASLSTDQRGEGFPRSTGAATDIGAYERAPTEMIFANGFDG